MNEKEFIEKYNRPPEVWVQIDDGPIEPRRGRYVEGRYPRKEFLEEQGNTKLDQDTEVERGTELDQGSGEGLGEFG